MRYPIKWIVIHHSATGRKTTVESIRTYHVGTHGWSDIGYQNLIRQPDDDKPVEIYAGRAYDGDGYIDPWEWGAHARGANHQSISICLIGNWSVQRCPEAMRENAAWLAAEYCAKLDLSPDAVIGHREVPGATPTECPGLKFNLTEFRRLVTNRLDSLKLIRTQGHIG